MRNKAINNAPRLGGVKGPYIVLRPFSSSYSVKNKMLFERSEFHFV